MTCQIAVTADVRGPVPIRCTSLTKREDYVRTIRFDALRSGSLLGENMLDRRARVQHDRDSRPRIVFISPLVPGPPPWVNLQCMKTYGYHFEIPYLDKTYMTGAFSASC